MRLKPIQFTFTVISFLFLIPVVTAQTQTQPKYSTFGYTFYNESRVGYEAPPVQMLRVGGGKRSADEKLKISVSLLLNRTEKRIKAVKFKAFIFGRYALDEALETIETPVLELDIQPRARRDCDLLILYADDIPLLAYRPGEEFLLEVAVAEVHYEDGTVWEAKNLPGKIDPSKVH